MSDNNTYFAQRTKERPVEEAMDFGVKIFAAWRMTGMWLANMGVYELNLTPFRDTFSYTVH